MVSHDWYRCVYVCVCGGGELSTGIQVASFVLDHCSVQCGYFAGKIFIVYL